MQKNTPKLTINELKQFEVQIKNEGLLQPEEKLDRLHLLMLYKLFEAERKIATLEKHIMTPLIH